MVGTVEILAVPACGEVVNRHDASRAGLLGEVWGLEAAGENGLKAGVAEALVSLSLCRIGGCGIADSHAKALKVPQQRFGIDLRLS